MNRNLQRFSHRHGITYFPFPIITNEIVVNQHTVGKLPSPGSPEPDFTSPEALAFSQRMLTNLMRQAKNKTVH